MDDSKTHHLMNVIVSFRANGQNLQFFEAFPAATFVHPFVPCYKYKVNILL